METSTGTDGYVRGKETVDKKKFCTRFHLPCALSAMFLITLPHAVVLTDYFMRTSDNQNNCRLNRSLISEGGLI